MKVFGLQFNIKWEDKVANFARVREMIAAQKPEANSLVALPEMFATGFSMNTGTVGELPGGETEQFLAQTAKEFGIYLIGGIAMRGQDKRCRNKALAFSPDGKLIAFYAKQRPFTPGGESDHYAAGTMVATFDIGDCAISPFICYDLRFPELFREAAQLHRPELFVVIASWPNKRITHWTRLLQARAIENQAYVLGVNRIGTDPYYEYSGGSILVDFNGEIIAAAAEAGDCVFGGALNLETLQKYRSGLPFLDDLNLRHI